MLSIVAATAFAFVLSNSSRIYGFQRYAPAKRPAVSGRTRRSGAARRPASGHRTSLRLQERSLWFMQGHDWLRRSRAGAAFVVSVVQRRKDPRHGPALLRDGQG